MFWVCLIFSVLVSRGEYGVAVTAQNARPTIDQGLSTSADGQMTNLLDVLTIYSSVVSFSPSSTALIKCCDSVTMTPHLDLLFVFTRHVHSFVKYASETIYNMMSDPTVLPPCLPEAKPPDMALVRDVGGEDRPPPPPPASPPLPSKPPQPLPSSYPKESAVYTSLTPYRSPPPPRKDHKRPRPPRPRKRKRRRKEQCSAERWRRRRRRKTKKKKKEEKDKEKEVQTRDRGDTKESGGGRTRTTEITAMGAVLSESFEFSPTLWVITGAVLGLALAVVWNLVYRNGSELRRTGDLARDIASAIADCLHDMGRSLQEPHERALVVPNDTAHDRNDSLARRMRRRRRRLRRKKRRRRHRHRDRDRYYESSQTDSPTTAGPSSESSMMVMPLGFDRKSIASQTEAKRVKIGEIFTGPKKLKKTSRHSRKAKKWRREKRRKREAERVRFSSQESVDPLSWTLTYASDLVLGPQLTGLTSSESTTVCTSEEFVQHTIDAVQLHGMGWDNSDEYSEAHSVGQMGSASQSTCSSLRDEFTGPWVSTSLSFVVYDLDVIDDIPDEVLEVLSCDTKPCETHPHDRYHYVGSKIIVQRLPLPAGCDGQTHSITYLPNLSISPNNTVTASDPIEPAVPAVPKKHVRIADKVDDLVSCATNTDNVDVADSSVQTQVSLQNIDKVQDLVSCATNTDIVDVADSSMQTEVGLQNAAVNTSQMEVADCSSQTPKETFVSIGTNTVMNELITTAVSKQPVHTADVSLQISLNRNDLVSSAVNTDYVDLADAANQTSLVTEESAPVSVVETATNTHTTLTSDAICETMPVITADACTEMLENLSVSCCIEHEDNSTQTSEEEDPANTSADSPVKFPMAMKKNRLCGPAAKAASAAFRGSDIRYAMSCVKETYEECLTNPFGESYYPKQFPLPEKISQKSPAMCAKNDASKASGRTVKSPRSKTKSSGVFSQTLSPSGNIQHTSFSMGDAVTVVMDTVKGVYDHCTKDALPRRLEISRNTTDYPPESTENIIHMSRPSEHSPSKIDKMKHAAKKSEKGSGLSIVFHQSDSLTKYVEDQKQASDKNTGKKTGKHLSHKSKEVDVPNKDQMVASQSAKPTEETARATEETEKTINTEIHMAQAKSVSSNASPNSNKRGRVKDSLQHVSSGIKESKETSESPSFESKTTKKSQSQIGRDDSVPDKSVLFKELKDKVAKRQSLQEDSNLIQPSSVHSPDLNTPAIETSIRKTTQKLLATPDPKETRRQPQRKSICPQQAKESTLADPMPSTKTESKSTSKMYNVPQQKEDLKSPQKLINRTSEQKDTDASKKIDFTHQQKENELSPLKACVISKHKAKTWSPTKLCITSPEKSDKVSITSHAKGDKDPIQRVCVTIQTKEKAQPLENVCSVQQQKEKIPSPRKICIVSQQTGEVKSHPKICIASELKGKTPSPQRLRVITHQNADKQVTQKLCITRSQAGQTQSPPKVCIIPKQNRSTRSPPKDRISRTEIGKTGSSLRVITPVEQNVGLGNNFQKNSQETDGAKPGRSSCYPQSNKKRDTESTKETRSPMEYFRKVIPPCTTVAYANRETSSQEVHDSGRVQSHKSFEMGQGSKKRPWGNLEQVYDSRRNRSPVSATDSVVPVTSVAKNIKEIYDRCTAGKPKTKLAQQTKSKTATSPTERSLYEHFDEIASGATINQTKLNTDNKEHISQSQLKETKRITSSANDQPTKRQKVSLLKDENVQKQTSDSGPIPVLPLAFPFVSKSPGKGTPPPSDQDSSNSAERVSSATLHTEHTRQSSPSVDKKKPYQSLSKVCMKEPSPPWEVSDRAKNNVFSPVGWTSPRSGITSLFRGQSYEKMVHFGHDANKSKSSQTWTSEQDSHERHASNLRMGEKTTTGSALHTISSVSVTQPTQSGSQHNAHSVTCLSSENTFSTGLRSSVKHDVLACGQNESAKDKHYCSIHPDMVEMAKVRPRVREHQNKDDKHNGHLSAEHKPRIVSRARLQKQKSLVPRLSKLAGVTTSTLPSRPPTPQLMAKLDCVGDVTQCAGETSFTEDKKERNENHIPRKTNETRPCIEIDKSASVSESIQFPQQCKQQERMLQQNETGRQDQQHENIRSLTPNPVDDTLLRTVTGKYRLCSYTNDINEEFKEKLSNTLKPSQIRRGKRKSDRYSAAGCENVRTTISPECTGGFGSPSPSKTKSRLPVSPFSLLRGKEENAWQPPSFSNSAQKYYENIESDDKGSSITDRSRDMMFGGTAHDLPNPRLISQSKIPNVHGNENFQYKRKTARRTEAKRSKQSTNPDGHKLQTVQYSTKRSRIPVSKQSRYKRPAQGCSGSNVTLKSDSVDSAYTETESAPESAYVSSESYAGSSDNQLAIPCSERNNRHPGTAKLKHESDNHSCRTSYCSRLPVPTFNSSIKHQLKMVDKTETKPVSSMIAQRIRLLQASVLERQTTIPRETKHIKKLTSYFNDAKDDNDERTKGDCEDVRKAKQTVSSAAQVQVNECTTTNRQNQTAVSSPRKTVQSKMLLVNEAVDKLSGSTVKSAKRSERDSNTFTYRKEGNISQNHNWGDVSLDSLYSSQNLSSETTLSFCSSDSSTLDFSVIQIIANLDEKNIDSNAAEPSASFFANTAESVFASVTKELKDLVAANGGELCPSHIKQNKPISKLSEANLRPSSNSLAFSNGLDDTCQNSRTGNADCSYSMPANTDASTGRDDCHPHQSPSANDTVMVDQLAKDLSSYVLFNGQTVNSDVSRELSQTVNTSISRQTDSASPQDQQDPAFCIPCEVSDAFDLSTDAKNEHEESNLSSLGYPLEGDNNLADIMDVIGPPQANSSFMDELDDTALPSPVSDNAGIQCTVFSSDLNHENPDIISANLKPNKSDSNGEGERHVASVYTSATSKLTMAQDGGWNEMGGLADVPVAGSTDIMSRLLTPGSMENSNFSEPSTRNLKSFHLYRGEEMLHITDVSRELRFYGQNSIMELGVTRVLKNTVSRISAKGDNLSVLNSDTADKTNGTTASF